MAIETDLWRARIGGFLGPKVKNRKKLQILVIGGRDHCFLKNVIIIAMIIITLCGDVETNPGPLSPRRQIQQNPYQESSTHTSPGHQPSALTGEYYAPQQWYNIGPAQATLQNQHVASYDNNALYQMIDQRMTKIDNKMEQIFQQQIGTDAKIANVQKALDEMVVRQDQFDGSLGQMELEIDKLRKENAQLSSKVEAIHRKSTLHNIRIFDFPIRDGEANSELDLKAAFQN